MKASLSNAVEATLVRRPVMADPEWLLDGFFDVVLRAFRHDLEFIHDLGICPQDHGLAALALESIAKSFEEAEYIAGKKFQIVPEMFTKWADNIPSPGHTRYWYLQRIKQAIRATRIKLDKAPNLSYRDQIDAVKALYEPFVTLVRKAPASFYCTSKVLRSFLNYTDAKSSLRSDTAEPEIVRISSISYPLYRLLQRDLNALYGLTPNLFEEFICERLHDMGMNVFQAGQTYVSDGGVDIIATPRDSVFPFLLAVQVKHHATRNRKTGPTAVKDMQAVLASLPFHAGMIVTNTTFTPDANWWASKSPGRIQLHDLRSISNWIHGRYAVDVRRNIPQTIELTPRMSVQIW